MTIGNRFFKAISLLLVLCILLCALPSCKTQTFEIPFELLNATEEAKDTEISGEEETEEEAPEEEEEILPDPLSAYRIIIPYSCTSELFSAAKELGQKLTEQTGVFSEVLYDTEKTASSKNMIEILLGRCERTESKRTLSDLRRDDYVCQFKDNVIVLGGNSESATFAALDRFYEDLFASATAVGFFPTSNGFLHRAEYGVSSITVNGFELFDYTILYDQNASSKEIALAKSLQQTLYTDRGYVLDLVSTAEFQGDRKQIYLTVDPEEPKELCRIFANEQGITLSARDLFGLSVAVQEWTSRLLSTSENGTVSLSLSGQEVLPYTHTAHTVASLWIDPESRDINEVNALTNTVKQLLPELVLMNPLSDGQASLLFNPLSGNYSVQDDGALFHATAICQFVTDFEQTLGASAKLYQIGEGSDAFLLLHLDRFPTQELPDALKNRTLPLIIVVNTDLDGLSDQASRLSDERLSLEHSKIYQSSGTDRVFAIYAEAGCFTSIEVFGDNAYRSVTVQRLSAFYPYPS